MLPVNQICKVDDETFVSIIRIQKNRVRRAIENNHRTMIGSSFTTDSLKIFTELSDYIKNKIGIYFYEAELQDVLDLFPFHKMDMQDGDIAETADALVANLLLNCDWPTFGDKVDMEKFQERLKQSARLMGYKVIEDL